MIAPIYKVCGYCFSDFVYLLITFIFGIGFGYILEASGFGSSRKLTATFYLRDMAVVKVMFTAIITAMFGLTLFGSLGIMDLSKVYINPTYLYPQIVGGFIFGVGFVIGGYCPGTSAVAFVTGKLDGLMFALGLMVGIFIFGESLTIKSFYNFFNSTVESLKGHITLPEVLGMGRWIVTILIILIAIGAFYFSEWAEKKFGQKS